MSILRPISFSPGEDDDVLIHLDTQSNKSRYVKDLIRKDMGLPPLEQSIADKVLDYLEKRLQSINIAPANIQQITQEEDFNMDDVLNILKGGSKNEDDVF